MHDGQPHVIHVWHHEDFLQQRKGGEVYGLGGGGSESELALDASDLEFLVQFSLYPVSNVSQSDFSLPQLWSGLQFQVRRRPEAIPARNNQTMQLTGFIGASLFSSGRIHFDF